MKRKMLFTEANQLVALKSSNLKEMKSLVKTKERHNRRVERMRSQRIELDKMLAKIDDIDEKCVVRRRDLVAEMQELVFPVQPVESEA